MLSQVFGSSGDDHDETITGIYSDSQTNSGAPRTGNDHFDDALYIDLDAEINSTVDSSFPNIERLRKANS